jgi:hypothetical protein
MHKNDIEAEIRMLLAMQTQIARKTRELDEAKRVGRLDQKKWKDEIIHLTGLQKEVTSAILTIAKGIDGESKLGAGKR